jgi:cobalamin biosynthesis protein CobT
MATQREASPRTRAAAAALLMLFADDDEDMSWVRDPAAAEPAPGDERHDIVDASANDQFEGEEGSDCGVEVDEGSDNGHAAEGEADEVDEDEEGEADTTTQAPQPAPEPKKITRHRWETRHHLVLYLLNQHYNYEIHFLAKVFNRVFRRENFVRTDNALE